MVRQIVGLGVAFSVVLGLLAAPAPVQHARGGSRSASFRAFGSPGFRAAAGRGFSAGFRDFDRGFDRRFAFGDPRFVSGFGGFGGYGVSPGFFSPVPASGFGPHFVQPVFFTPPSGFVRPIFVPGF